MEPKIQTNNALTSIPGQLNRMIGVGTPDLAQITSGSPNFQPQLIPPANTPMPQKSPMDDFKRGLANNLSTGGGAQMQSTQQKPPKNALQSRADLIVKALTSHLANLDKVLQGNPEEQTQNQPQTV